MKLNDLEMTIYVKGRPITEYLHQGHTFVEGRAGSEYEIELHNHTYSRVEAVLSVDGLSIIDGKPAGPQSQGYLINGRGTVRIPGWMLDATKVAKFAFSGMQQSYTAQSGKDVGNNGVIGAMVFREKFKPIPQPIPYLWIPVVSPTVIPPYPTYPQYVPSNVMYGSSGIGMGDLPSGGGVRGMACGSASGSVNMHNVMTSQCFNAGSPSASVSNTFAEQSLGTAFGEATKFATHTVVFERGDLLATLLCFYDERRGLKARGIKVAHRSRQKLGQPQAFPGSGCEPPLGWMA